MYMSCVSSGTSLWRDTVGIQWRYSEGTVGIQWGTVRVQWEYSGDTECFSSYSRFGYLSGERKPSLPVITG